MKEVDVIIVISVIMGSIAVFNILGGSNFNRSVTNTSVSSASGFKQEVNQTTCDIGGWDATVDIGKCVYGWVMNLVDLFTFNTSNKILNYLLITPLAFALVYVIVKALPFT